MTLSRREFISLGASGLATAMLWPSAILRAAEHRNIKAIAFDAFPVFDPRPVFALVKSLYPEQGDAFAKLWFNKIFGYTWLRTSAGQYKNFPAVIEDALSFTAGNLNADITPEKRKQLLDIWFALDVWPDVKPALQHFQDNNIRLAFLSNMTEDMLRTNARNAGIEDMFEFYLSTDAAGVFKPHPAAYQLGIDSFALPKENIAFAAFAGWDAAGAGWFGYPTIWVNRLNNPAEELGNVPAITTPDISGLESFVLS